MTSLPKSKHFNYFFILLLVLVITEIANESSTVSCCCQQWWVLSICTLFHIILWPPRGWEACQSSLQTCSALYLDPKLCLACGDRLINNCRVNWTIFSNLSLWFSELDTIITGKVGTLELMQCCPPLLSISVSFLQGCIPFEFCSVSIIMSLIFWL